MAPTGQASPRPGNPINEQLETEQNMQTLHESLERMRATFKERESAEQMQQHGLISGAGQSITQNLMGGQLSFGPTEMMQPAMQQQEPQASSPSVKQSVPLAWDEIPISDSPQAQDHLTMLLSQVYAAQATYGDKAQMMEWRDQIFQMVLGRFNFQQVKTAFVKFLEIRRDLPAPADIVQIIEPPKEKLSAAMYVALKKRIADGEYLYGSDRQYLRAFEEQEMAKMRGGSEELREAQREIADYTRMQQIEYHD